MSGPFATRILLTATLAVITALAVRQVAAAQESTVIPAGIACEFELRVESETNPNRMFREWRDSDGNLVRTLEAGRGSDVTLVNTETGESLTLKGNGAVNHTTYNPDGSWTTNLTGHYVLILWPTDIPAGPSTTLYVGRVTYTSTPDSTFALVGSSGTQRDLCAELS
jgi:hypothetical protein